MNERLYNFLNPFSKVLAHNRKLLFAVRYYRNLHRCIQLKSPQLFYDKIFWLACHGDTSLWSDLADKYKVREYVTKRYNSSILNELLGVYDSPEEIDYDNLPHQFVLKTNNACATNIIVRDKKEIDRTAINRQLGKRLKLRYGDISGQLHYSKIAPKIIAERLLIQDGNLDKPLTDYKFNCFNGVPVECAVFADRVENTHVVSRMLYDMEWNAHPEYYDTASPRLKLTEAQRPSSFNEMKKVAQALSAGFPYVRVDLYEIEGKPVFGEMTFMPGLDALYSLQHQKDLGALIVLPQ